VNCQRYLRKMEICARGRTFYGSAKNSVGICAKRKVVACQLIGSQAGRTAQ
jgi:hypothetical protein